MTWTDAIARKLNAKRNALMQFLEEINDPRTPSNGTLHCFKEILVINCQNSLP
jgi:hypothetical protein